MSLNILNIERVVCFNYLEKSPSLKASDSLMVPDEWDIIIIFSACARASLFRILFTNDYLCSLLFGFYLLMTTLHIVILKLNVFDNNFTLF